MKYTEKVKALLTIAALVPTLSPVAVGLAAVPSLALNTGGTPAGPAGGPVGGDVPPGMLRLYGAAAGSCPGLSWTVLAAIGAVESDHGRSTLPGVRSGRNPAGAEGPMQFEPATFDAYAYPVPPGGEDPPSPYDAADAVWAAARMLCADGAGDPSRLGAALFDYDHSSVYVADVLAEATTLGLTSGGRSTTRGAAALEFALSQVGTPYVWGGEAPGEGFDCSGLTQAAWARAGVAIPRVAQDQLSAGPRLPAGGPLQPGDLVFFGPAPGRATHVGLVVDPRGVMVDAPHTGAEVRVEGFTPVLGSPWGSDFYIGATTPGG